MVRIVHVSSMLFKTLPNILVVERWMNVLFDNDVILSAKYRVYLHLWLPIQVALDSPVRVVI